MVKLSIPVPIPIHCTVQIKICLDGSTKFIHFGYIDYLIKFSSKLDNF